MRHAMWKVHCLAVVLLTAINLYLLVKLTNCSDRIGAHWSGNASDDVEFDPWTRPVKRSWKFVRIKQSFIGTEPDEVDELGAVWAKHARYDASRRFAIRDFAIVGANFHSTAVSHDVCLSTQSSLDRIVSLAEAAEHWAGAVSLAVYVDADEVRVFERVVRHLHRCHADLLSNVAFHVVSAAPGPLSDAWPEAPAAAAAAAAESGNNGTAVNCTDAADALAWLRRERPPLSAKWESGRAYPQNLMRNVARKGCPARHAMLLDVDVIPSYDMAEHVSAFLSAAPDCAKCAYVVPTYELDHTAEFPVNKSQLLSYESRGRAQPFHHKAFRYNQYASNLTRWAQTGETDRTVVSHNVTNYEFFYEPFYIARDDAPQHDERFIGYGFTRNTQVYEMALAGWTFHVLSPVFTVHWGMQMRQRRPTWRKNQMDRNRRVFDAIHNELKVRYGLVSKGPVRWHAKPGKPVNKS